MKGIICGATLEGDLKYLAKVKVRLSYGSAILPLSTYSEKFSRMYLELHIRMFSAALFEIVKDWK